MRLDTLREGTGSSLSKLPSVLKIARSATIVVISSGAADNAAEDIAMANPLDRISIDPAVCGGKPCIRGTRIWVSLVLDFLASGTTEAELLGEYPQLTHDDVLAAIAYGAEASRERVIPVPVEPAA
jgi:uncharacterized protein (DUF433 family)